MKIDRKVLLEGLTFLKAAIKPHRTHPVLSFVKIAADKGVLTMTVTDLEQQLEWRTEVDGSIQDICIPFDRLMAITTMSNAETISAKMSEQRVTVLAGKSRFQLPTIPGEEMPVVSTDGDEVASGDWKAIREEVKASMFCLPLKDVRYYLLGVNLNSNFENKIAIAASDGARAFRSTLDYEGGEFNIIIPKPSLSTATSEVMEKFKLHPGVLTLIGTSHRARLKLIDHQYPDVARNFPPKSAPVVKSIKSKRKALLSAIEEAGIARHSKIPGMRVSVKGGVMEIFAANEDGTESNVTLDVEFKGDEIKFVMDFNILADTVANSPADVELLWYANETDRAPMIAHNGHRSIIAMPYRK